MSDVPNLGNKWADVAIRRLDRAHTETVRTMRELDTIWRLVEPTDRRRLRIVAADLRRVVRLLELQTAGTYRRDASRDAKA